MLEAEVHDPLISGPHTRAAHHIRVLQDLHLKLALQVTQGALVRHRQPALLSTQQQQLLVQGAARKLHVANLTGGGGRAGGQWVGGGLGLFDSAGLAEQYMLRKSGSTCLLSLAVRVW